MVGDILRRERERQKLSVKDIEQGTSIRALYIEAIENGEYDKLPGSVYTKGFIKNYGNFLKLEGETLSRQFSEEISPPALSVSTESNLKEVSAKLTPAPVQIDDTSKIMNEPIPNMDNPGQMDSNQKIAAPRLIREKSNSGFIVAAIILIAAVIGGLWYYFTNIEGKEIAQNPPGQTQTDTTSSTAMPASASTPDSANASTNVINLQAKFNNRCWTKVVVDGRTAFEDTVEAGQTLNWQGTDRIIVTAGNAGAVEFIENGKNLGIAGAEGDVVERTFVRR